MQKIKNIIFDLGGVILNIDNKLTQEAFIKLGVKNFPEIFGHGHAASFILEYEIGEITDEEFIIELKKISRLSVSDEQILAAWNIMLLDFPPERIQLLNELKKHYRLFLFSNTNALHVVELKKRYRAAFNNNELDDHFEKAYYSQILGMRKPDVEPFLQIIKENNLLPEETLFIDDALINIEGANAAGLKGYFLEPGKTILDIDWNF
jgi:HAD superfamily hydrolase (TIGR01509 family)